MQYWTIRLVRRDNGAPVIPAWTPTVRPEEFAEANRRLRERDLPWRWVRTTSTPCSDSTATSSPSPATS